MDQRQKKAFYNIKWAANDLLGGLENTLLDYPEDSDEYKSAYAFLHDHDGLVKRLYEDATTCVYGPGYCGFGPEHEKLIRDNIPLTFSPRYLGYVRCDECKQAEVKDEQT